MRGERGRNAYIHIHHIKYCLQSERGRGRERKKMRKGMRGGEREECIYIHYIKYFYVKYVSSCERTHKKSSQNINDFMHVDWPGI